MLEMVETGNGTVTPVVSNLRIDPALVDGYLPFAHFFPSFFIRMLYLLHSLVKYICMPIYPRVLVYQDKMPEIHHLLARYETSTFSPLTHGQIAGIVVGSIAVALAAICLLFFGYLRSVIKSFDG